MRLLSAAVASAVIAITGSLFVASPAAAQNRVATVTTSLNARSGPGTSYGVLFVMSAGTQVGVYECVTSGWCQILYGNRTGWASGRYLRFADAAASGVPEPVVVPQGAVSARVTVQLNLRRGPGTSYGVILAIPTGATVTVTQCVTGNTWCEAIYGGYTGWVAAAYLTYGQQPAPNAGPGVGIQLQFNFGQAPANARACFYQDWNYGGASFCLTPGQEIAALDNNWNDRISSIRLEGGAEVRVCRDFNFDGPCSVYSSSVPQLTGENDAISSIRVRD